MKAIVMIVLLAVAAGGGYFVRGNVARPQDVSASPTPAAVVSTGDGKVKTYTFDNFHGSTDISDKFRFQYPASWSNEGQYFSPQKIQYYDLYSVKAPIFFDLILADIFDLTEFKYQIDTSARRNPDTTGQIDGRTFSRYDLIDYGSYGGESAGRVKIFVGPKITVDGDEYYLVFHWEERPLTEEMPGNAIEVFDTMLLTLDFL
jgi:hypothetical protein